MTDKLSHCCCVQGCDLWSYTLPAGSSQETPPEGFSHASGQWEIDELLSADDWVLSVIVNDFTNENIQSITLDKEGSSDRIRIAIISDSVAGTIAGSRLEIKFNDDDPFVARMTLQHPVGLRRLELVLSGGQLWCYVFPGMLVGSQRSPPINIGVIWRKSAVGNTYDGLTGNVVNEPTLAMPKTFRVVGFGSFGGILLPADFAAGKWKVSWQEPHDPEENAETTLVASRWSANESASRHDCPRPKGCEQNRPFFEAVNIDPDLVYPSLLTPPDELYSNVSINKCTAAKAITYDAGAVYDSLSGEDFGDRQNMGVIVAAHTITGDPSNPANWDMSLPNRPVRSYTSSPLFRRAQVSVTLLETLGTTMRLNVFAEFQFTTRTEDNVDGIIQPERCGESTNSQTAAVLFSTGNRRYAVKPSDIPAGSNLYGTRYSMGWNFVGESSTLFNEKYRSGERMSASGEVEVPLFTHSEHEILIPLTGMFPDESFPVLTGESIEVVSATLNTSGTFYVPEWHVILSQTTVQFNPNNAKIRIRPNPELPFVA